MREQKTLEIATEHPAFSLTGRNTAHRLYCLGSTLDASPATYSLYLVLRNIFLMLQVNHITSASKTARTKLGQSHP